MHTFAKRTKVTVLRRCSKTGCRSIHNKFHSLRIIFPNSITTCFVHYNGSFCTSVFEQGSATLSVLCKICAREDPLRHEMLDETSRKRTKLFCFYSKIGLRLISKYRNQLRLLTSEKCLYSEPSLITQLPHAHVLQKEEKRPAGDSCAICFDKKGSTVYFRACPHKRVCSNCLQTC